MGLLRSLVARGVTTPTDPRTSQRWVTPFGLSGVYVSMESALDLSVVWACVDAITKAIASCDWNVFVRDEKNRRTHLPNDALAWMLNVRPNPDMSGISFREAMLFNALTWGNAYAEIVRDRAGRIMELWPLQSDRVTLERNDAGDLVYKVMQANAGPVYVPQRDMFHLKGPGVTGLLGENVVSRAAKTLALAAAAERFATTYFGNNTVIGGVLEHPGALSDEAYSRIATSWAEGHRGPDRAHKPAILENGMKWMPFSNDAEKAQLIESRKFQIEEICRWYGVPPHKVQHLDRSTFNNIEHLGIEFNRDAIRPWARRLDQEASFKLCPQKAPWRFTELDTDWLQYGDAKSRAEADQIYRRMGVYSANDILDRLGRNTIGPEGDVRLVETNMTTVEGIEKTVEQIGKEKPAPDPAPMPEPEADPEEEADDAPMMDARAAAFDLFHDALERHSRRISNRRADVKELADEDLAKLTGRIGDDCAAALKFCARAGGKVSALNLAEHAAAIAGGASPAEHAALIVAQLWGHA